MSIIKMECVIFCFRNARLTQFILFLRKSSSGRLDYSLYCSGRKMVNIVISVACSTFQLAPFLWARPFDVCKNPTPEEFCWLLLSRSVSENVIRYTKIQKWERWKTKSPPKITHTNSKTHEICAHIGLVESNNYRIR